MPKLIKNKQINPNTITQDRLNLDLPVLAKDAVTLEYLNSLSGVSKLSLSNKSMTALSTTGTTGYVLACNTGVTDAPNSGSQFIVAVNGLHVAMGSGYSCIFRDSGNTVWRDPGYIEQTDLLYWDNDLAGYYLTENDTIDFIYLVSGTTIENTGVTYDDTIPAQVTAITYYTNPSVSNYGKVKTMVEELTDGTTVETRFLYYTSGVWDEEVNYSEVKSEGGNRWVRITYNYNPISPYWMTSTTHTNISSWSIT